MKKIIIIIFISPSIFNISFSQELNEFQRINPSNGANIWNFGICASISNNTAVIGSLNDNYNGNQGIAHVFENNGSYWVEKASLTASDGETGNWFGTTVAIEGNVVVVGAKADDDMGNSSGSVYIFEKIGNFWIETAKLLPLDGNAQNFFGASVAISGGKIIIGAPSDSDLSYEAGSAYVFENNGVSWVQTAKLLASNGSIRKHFGSSVSIFNDKIIVGAPGDSFLTTNYGSAYIFEYNGSSWEERENLAATDNVHNNHFGYSVSINDTFAVVGASGDTGIGLNTGATYIYVDNGNSYNETNKLFAQDGSQSDYFGVSVFINAENKIIVGESYGNSNKGAAYIFENDGGNWNETKKLLSSNGLTGDSYGCNVVISEKFIIVGAYANDFMGDQKGSSYIFNLKGVTGSVYNDLSLNCVKETSELGVFSKALIQPGHFIVETNSNGNWYLDSLPEGDYTLTIDTTNTNWTSTCPIIQSFTIVNVDSLTIAPSFGVIANNPCPEPVISIHMPSMRPCFTNQQIYVEACNEYNATGILLEAYSIVDLESSLIFESANFPFTALGNNQYRFEHDTLYPGECVNYMISAQVSCDAILGQTLCMEANLYPVASCVLDTIPSPPTGEVSTCILPWDQSSLTVEGWCANDSIYFTVLNHGSGDMACYSPVRIFVDGQLIILDSILLLSGDNMTYVFAGTAQTWILQADQHPLHPGNSHPNAHVENCGTGTWTPDLINDLPLDDADPVVDIYCGIVTGSYDPNDKRGYPSGISDEHFIAKNQELEYIIRFQNTGTDTAFTVVVRDTIDENFNIFTVKPGVSSHPYSFRMYGPRVLEWTFSNILLPDSTINEPLSNGFLSFTIQQNPDLAEGTVLRNNADIYFDFNSPIITNETEHKISYQINNIASLEKLKTQKSSLKLYPNPSNSSITIDLNTFSKSVNYKIYTLSGKLLQEKENFQGQKISVDIQNLKSGFYFIEVLSNNSKEVLHFIKN